MHTLTICRANTHCPRYYSRPTGMRIQTGGIGGRGKNTQSRMVRYMYRTPVRTRTRTYGQSSEHNRTQHTDQSVPIVSYGVTVESWQLSQRPPRLSAAKTLCSIRSRRAVGRLFVGTSPSRCDRTNRRFVNPNASGSSIGPSLQPKLVSLL
jgi:hypothetical protein